MKRAHLMAAYGAGSHRLETEVRLRTPGSMLRLGPALVFCEVLRSRSARLMSEALPRFARDPLPPHALTVSVGRLWDDWTARGWVR